MFITKIQVVLTTGLALSFVATGMTIFASRMASGQGDKKTVVEQAAEFAEKQAEAEELKSKDASGEFGEAVGGLRIQLQLAGKEGGKSPSHCAVVMENVGDTDLNVNLGISLANGKSHHPVALRLMVIEREITTRLSYGQPRMAGRLDPFVIPLPIGSRYTLRCPLDKFVLTEGGERFDFTAKDFRVEAELAGRPVTETNSDMQGLTLMQFWQGAVQSNQQAWSSPGDGKKP